MVRVVLQKLGQQRGRDSGKGAQRFKIADTAAVAFGPQTFDAANLLVWNQYMSQLTAKPFTAFDHFAFGDNTPAQAGADEC